ncbi:MAG TPA: hypothetical protein VHM92_00520 [Allosphingosinicella sp.]|nr:hypothetical protein [Allosphingosinicella sp.]
MSAEIRERRKLNLPDRLPPLHGRGLAFFGVAWSMLFIVALAGVGYGAWADFQPQPYGFGYIGISVDDGGRIVDVVPETEAAAQGIARGEAVLAVDGVSFARLGNSTATVRDAVQRPEGTAVSVTVRDLHANIVTHRLTRRAVNVRRYAALDRLTAVNNVFNCVLVLAAALILFRQRREPVPALMSVSFVLQAISSSFSFWSAIGIDIAFLNAPSWSLLLISMLVFPDGRIQSRWAWLTAAAVAGCAVTGSGMGDNVLWPVLGALFAAVAAHLTFRYRGLPSGIERQQVRWAFLGIVSGLGSYAAAIALFSALRAYGLFDELWLRGLGLVLVALGTTFMVTGLIVSLMRYRLYDADAVIGRSAAYGVLTLGFVGLFAGGEKVIEVVGERYFGEGLGVSAAGLAAGVAAALIVPMHHRVSHWAEHRFQKALIRLREGVPLLVGDLRETAAPEVIAAAVVDATSAGVHATHAALLVDNAILASCGVPPETITAWRQNNEPTERELPRDLFPTRVSLAAESTGRIGWLLLGPRPDGTPVGKDERETLTEIAGPIARAMEIARTRERRDAAFGAVLASVEARLASLEKGMARMGARSEAAHHASLTVGDSADRI